MGEEWVYTLHITFYFKSRHIFTLGVGGSVEVVDGRMGLIDYIFHILHITFHFKSHHIFHIALSHWACAGGDYTCIVD